MPRSNWVYSNAPHAPRLLSLTHTHVHTATHSYRPVVIKSPWESITPENALKIFSLFRRFVASFLWAKNTTNSGIQKLGPLFWRCVCIDFSTLVSRLWYSLYFPRNFVYHVAELLAGLLLIIIISGSYRGSFLNWARAPSPIVRTPVRRIHTHYSQ